MEVSGVGDGQVGLACCDSWGRKELDTMERLICFLERLSKLLSLSKLKKKKAASIKNKNQMAG